MIIITVIVMMIMINFSLSLQVLTDKHSLKLLKSQSINVNWYMYCPETSVILLSTTVQGNVLQPFAFKVSDCPSCTRFVSVSVITAITKVLCAIWM